MADAPNLYLRFSETSGTNAADSSGNGRDFTLTAATGRGAPSLLASDTDPSWDANGTTAAQRSTESWMLPDVGPFTFEALVEADSLSSYRAVGGIEGSGSQGWVLYFYQNALGVLHNGTWYARGRGTTVVGATYHVAVTYTGTQITTYLNGAQNGTSALSLPNPLISYPFRVGAAGEFSPNRFWDGRIDEAAHYPTALPPARILAHAQAAGVA